MKKSTLAIIVAVIAIVAVAGVVVANNMSNEKNKSSSEASSANTNSSEADEMANMDTSQTPTPNAGSSDTAQASAVTIQEFSFNPAKITVKKGTKVTWTNKDSTKHDVTPDTEGAFTKSELLGQNESYSVTFDTVGSFSYHCSPHPYMKGIVEVTE
ncbi:MAG TPA: cupredoxin family copper-binding protein [Verrucomicrobiae bacterium]|nr:cupredoxin family copper-binding protein [Verrucomicrobiae bacterium]